MVSFRNVAQNVGVVLHKIDEFVNRFPTISVYKEVPKKEMLNYLDLSQTNMSSAIKEPSFVERIFSEINKYRIIFSSKFQISLGDYNPNILERDANLTSLLRNSLHAFFLTGMSLLGFKLLGKSNKEGGSGE